MRERQPPGDLPTELTSFVGREREIAEVGLELSRTRLLTLTGPGGVGKTRLALEVATQRRADFADGVRFVNLAPIADPSMVAQAVLVALGLRHERERSALEGLVARLRPCQLLLVLDNCEHLLSGCGPLADALLRACPGLRLLATSREPLGIAGETVWTVPALSLPDRWHTASVEALLLSEAGRLFVERAAAARSGFTPRQDNAQSIAEICWQLDGIPLAIELAAVCVRGLSVGQLAGRLEDRFRVLSRGPRAGPPRHQTLRAAVDWSYELLSEAERVLFNRLSVFTGGWPLAAAEAVCGGGLVASDDVLQLLQRLVDRSLVVADEQAGEMRYRLLETLRQYAAEHLALAGEQVDLRNRHRDWCVQVAEAGERDIWRAEQLECVERLVREHDNVRTALRWTLTCAEEDPEPGLRIAAAMVRFWDVHGDLREGIRWLDDLLRLPSVRPHRLGWARAVTARAYLATLAGQRALGIALLDDSLAFWRALGDPRGLAIALFFRGVAVIWSETDLRASRPDFEESLAFARQRGPRWTVYFCLYCLGEVARGDGQFDRAHALLAESLALARASQDRWGAFHAEFGLASVELARGERHTAEQHAQRSLSLSLELGDSRGSTYAFETLACIAAEDGEAVRAARLFGAAQALREPLGDFLSATAGAARERALARIRGRLGDAALEAALEVGRRLSLEDAVALARTSRRASDTIGDGLTAREREVARLVASGLSNREIAEAMVISERTAESHLTHMFTKLGLRSRTQLAAWALEKSDF
ncbi:MAG: AAA family ATPase [Chloroflexi bacterium]|nr:AAA family ATPase [Chloroflexota bacterium]